MILPRQEKPYMEMSAVQRYVKYAHLSPMERYMIHRKETTAHAIKNREKAREDEIAKAIEKQVINTVEKEISNCFK